ncbi:PREDICTED: cytochrome P450 6a2-like [Wasmannia auropunctata]|uniref:cytochrome P450 6a2-like n=1 Tax=Wasmannia auropunctata TaxID=64793 RepID=UPI0005EE68C4|nr:PREDICTED: cytochrome P450 6a2-like [Wasmannia auropunctata]
MTIILMSLILGALIALYFYMTRNYTYWQNRGVPCPDGVLPGFGHMLPVISLRTFFSDFCCKIYNDYKDCSMVGIYDFTSPTLMIFEPELVRTVLQTNFSNFAENSITLDPKMDPLLSHSPFVISGEKWLTSRKRLTYALSSPQRLKLLVESIKKVCTSFDNYINEKLSNKQTEFELKALFARHAAQVVAAIGFGVDGYSFDDEKKDISFRKFGQAIFEPTNRHKFMFALTFFAPSLKKIFKVRVIPKHVDHFFRTLVADLMEQSKKDGIPRNDFLHLMSELMRAEGNELDIEYLTSQTMLLVFEIYEVFSSVMSFVGLHMANYPEIQEKLREEVKSVLNRYNGEVTYESLREMTYMDQVLNESFRLLPAALIMKKRCTEEIELKGSDGIACRVQPGMEILLPVQALHKDPRYWKNPEEYDPDRFGPDRKYNIKKSTFFPFGEGPRTCVGMRSAQVQLKAVLAITMKTYTLKLSPRTQLPLKMIPGTILPTPVGGLWVTIQQL